MPEHSTSAASAAVAAIGAYQRYVSPYKGFCCAHRARTGHASCSQFARRAIERCGLLAGLSLLRRRLLTCAASYQALMAGGQKSSDAGPLNEPCPLFTLRNAKCCGGTSLASCWPFV
ncbi:membrane protein insertion efficiency factor YidD [Acidovorax sp.]|uniref:membrane protein insertion efficiency factor YidD n=1 Tax=Acidovorax sp. TaxID=1872122 RepID=UPI003A0FFE84